MRTSAKAARAVTALVGLAVFLTPAALAGSARAATTPDTVIAQDSTPAPVTPAAAPAAPRVVGIDASIVGGLVVTGAQGAPVTLTARGEKTRTLTPKPGAGAVFRQLTPGTTYTVAIGGVKVGTGVPVAAPAPAYGLTVSTTGTPDEVLLRWGHTPSKAQGAGVSFDVVATPISAIGRASSAPVIAGTTTATVTTMALDPAVKYTLSVTPRNSASTGRATAATMTRTLAELSGATQVPTTPTPAPATAAPAAPAPGPSTKTVYACPAGTVPHGDLCRGTVAYTITTQDYTFHKVATGPAPLLQSYETSVAACPDGYHYENYNWVAYCRQYGPAPTMDVKDATPAGYTDTGSHWASKGTAPAGYSDDGTAWVIDLPKIATTVPA